MKNLFAYILLVCIICACGSNTSKEKNENKVLTKAALVNDIKQLSDSLNRMFALPASKLRGLDIEGMTKYKTALSVTRIALINLNLDFFKHFPKDSLSAFCLADVQQLYDDSGAYGQALAYGDTIADNYPNFSNMVFVLEKNAAILDFNFEVRDTVAIRKAYERLLELPNVSNDMKRTYKERLSSLHLDLRDLLNQ